ncbi:MAG: hypothetical protein KatS3mg038_3609 [Candidatus Kapaibacterium sp.]|nr:MAG: hypothetical protein KatS3mg038_3609 [Candidatus Kapabacteria bacterium]
MRAIAAIVAALLVVGSVASAQQSDTTHARKKKQRAAHMASPAKSTDEAATSTSDTRVGTTKSGQVVYRGKKGGYYVLTPSGRKRYVKESDVIFDSSK